VIPPPRMITVRVPTHGPSVPAAVRIAATCPRCGAPRGARRPHPLNAGVDTWRNDCGHTDSYAAVLAESAKLAKGAGS
jgi:hypothetical protein